MTAQPERRLRLAMVVIGLDTGGAETMLAKLIGQLAPRHDIHVLSITDLGVMAPRLVAMGVPVEAIGMRRGHLSLPGFVRLVLRLRALAPDVVHTWMYHANILGGMAARLAGRSALVWGIRNGNLDPALHKASTLRVVRLGALLSGRVPDLILCNASASLDAHAQAGYRRSKMAVLPNGFDLGRFRPDAAARASLRAELGVAVDAPLVGLIGRFDPLKNHQGFVRAAALVHAERPDVHFVLAGTGATGTNAALVRWLGDAGVAHMTHLLGRRDDMPRLMAALDVLASSSAGEAFPNVIGEAMACGVPCAVTDVGDCAAIVGRFGRVVAAGDMAALAHQVLQLLALPAPARARSAEAMLRDVSARFDITHVARRHEQQYLALCAPQQTGVTHPWQPNRR